jgi:hypothetical protein
MSRIRNTNTCWNSFRKYGIRPTKSILATAADVAGDWIFYLRVNDEIEEEFEKFKLPLLAFALVSSVLGVLLLVSLIVDFSNRRRMKTRGLPPRTNFGICVKRILGLEIFIEDIPQFVMTAWVTAERGFLSPYAVFNITTSSFNFVLNILDMIEIDEDDDNEGTSQ